MENRQLFGLSGSLLLFIGVFAPLVSVPLMGSINYFQNGKGDGSIILVLAVISFVITLTRHYRGLWFTSLGSLLVMLITFMNFQSKMGDLKTNLSSGSGNNFFQGLADMAVQSIQLQWGWAILLAGIALLVTAAATGKENDNNNIIIPPNIPPQDRSRNITTTNLMPILAGLGGLVILFLIFILWNMQDNPIQKATPSPNIAAQTNQTIQQLQQQDTAQEIRQKTLRDAQQEADAIKQQAEKDVQQRLTEAEELAKPAIDSNTLNIQPNQGSTQSPLTREAVREELVAFFQKYYAALENNDVATLERLWNMRVSQAMKSINIVKNRVKKGIRGQGCSINDAQIRSFTESPTQATIYIDATCDVDGVKSDRFHSNFDLEKNFTGEWKLLKQASEK